MRSHNHRKLEVLAGRYVEHGVFAVGDRATSPLLGGFGVDVTSVFAAAEPT